MKQGIARDTLIMLIFTVVAIVILMPFTASALSKLNESMHDRMCSYSGILHSYMGSDITCTRKKVVISTDQVEINRGTKSVRIGNNYLIKYKMADFPEAVKYTMSDQMFRCWDMWGRGDNDLFQKNLIDKPRVCLVCAEITFDNKAKGQTITGLDRYMSETKITQFNIKDDYSTMLSSNIYEYQWKILYLPIYTGQYSSKSSTTSQVIDTSKDYAVVYTGLRKTWLESAMSFLGDTGVEYKDSGIYFVHLYDSNDLNSHCDIIYN